MSEAGLTQQMPPLPLQRKTDPNYTETVFPPLDRPQTFKKLPLPNLKCRLKDFSDGILRSL